MTPESRINFVGVHPRDVNPAPSLLFAVFWCSIVIVPLIGLLFWSVLEVDGVRVVFEPTLRAYAGLFESGRWDVTVRTLRIALFISVIEIALALPFSYWLAKGQSSHKVRIAALVLMTVPFFLSVSSRTIIWRAILGIHGPVNSVLMHAGIISQPIEWLLFSEFAVILGSIGPYFPNMFFPLFMSMSLIDNEYLEASRDLGASASHTFIKIVLPLSLPGLLAGFIFTFIPITGDAVIPEFLGGGQIAVLASSIESLIKVLNYPVAAALSVVMLALMIALILLVMSLLRGRITGSLLLGR